MERYTSGSRSASLLLRGGPVSKVCLRMGEMDDPECRPVRSLPVSKVSMPWRDRDLVAILSHNAVV
jgi:hypothetical protein